MSVDATERADYRAAPRHSFNPEILCQVIHPDTNRHWPAWVRDISVTGISLLVEPRLDPGTSLILDLRMRNGLFSRRLNAEVKHSAICFPNNCWLHGCVFQENLSDQEVARLAWSRNDNAAK